MLGILSRRCLKIFEILIRDVRLNKNSILQFISSSTGVNPKLYDKKFLTSQANNIPGEFLDFVFFSNPCLNSSSENRVKPKFIFSLKFTVGIDLIRFYIIFRAEGG